MLRFAATLCVLLFSAATFAQIDTIRIQDKKLVISQLTPTKRQYLVYLKFPKKDNLITNLSLWTREVSFEKVNKKEVIVIRQQWSGQDTLTNRKLWSICTKEDFKPLYHYSYVPKIGIEAFNFDDKKITGADSIALNGKKDFQIALTTPTFNWELDMETFEMLPLQAGRNFIISFYHPGSSRAPAYYSYKVIGSEKITAGTNKEIDCWKLKIEYDNQNYAIFWIARKQPEVIKMEEFYNGIYRYKIKLMTAI